MSRRVRSRPRFATGTALTLGFVGLTLAHCASPRRAHDVPLLSSSGPPAAVAVPASADVGDAAANESADAKTGATIAAVCRATAEQALDLTHAVSDPACEVSLNVDGGAVTSALPEEVGVQMRALFPSVRSGQETEVIVTLTNVGKEPVSLVLEKHPPDRLEVRNPARPQPETPGFSVYAYDMKGQSVDYPSGNLWGSELPQAPTRGVRVELAPGASAAARTYFRAVGYVPGKKYAGNPAAGGTVTPENLPKGHYQLRLKAPIGFGARKVTALVVVSP